MLKKLCQNIDKCNRQNLVVLVFFTFWLLINLLQAFFTELAHDEAYYWMYSRYLAWGYFDHPPMIAILVKIGYAVFHNELGVRLFPLLMGTSTMYVLYLLVKDEISSISLFIMMAFSVVIFQTHIGGFLAIPDLPVVFFAALFFLLYKKYIENNSVKLALLLGVVSACMLYSKYHGILVLIFTLGSNLKILKRWSFWIIPVLTIVLFLPHILWQIHNNFPTLQYHLIGRSSSYKFDHTFNYLYSQLLISGPFIGIILFYHAFRVKINEDSFLRAMKFNFIGFFVFFFITSFKGHVEPHWTAIAYIPLIVISFKSIQNSNKAVNWIRGFFILTFLLVLFLRVCLIVEILPSTWNLGAEFHNWDVWAKQIKAKAGDRKVVFVNSFQRPSKYAFYTGGDFAHTLNSIYYRRNQFDLWHFGDSIQGKKVLLIPARMPDDTIRTIITDYPVRFFENFKSYYDVKITAPSKEIVGSNNTSVLIDLTVWNNSNDTLIIAQSRGMRPPLLAAVLHNGKDFLRTIYLRTITDTILPNSSVVKSVELTIPEQTGTYSCNFAIVNDYLLPAANSRSVKLIVQ